MDTLDFTQVEPKTGQPSTYTRDPNLITNGVIKSRKKTSLKEFAMTRHIRPEVKAGFKVWLKGDYYHFESEWDKLFSDYVNRKI